MSASAEPARRSGASPVRRGALPAFLPLVIGGAWAVAILAWVAGWSGALGHDHLIEHGPGLGTALGLFVGDGR